MNLETTKHAYTYKHTGQRSLTSNTRVNYGEYGGGGVMGSGSFSASGSLMEVSASSVSLALGSVSARRL